VVDTWSGAPGVVRDSAALLADRADAIPVPTSKLGSVYAWPPEIRRRTRVAPTVLGRGPPCQRHRTIARPDKRWGGASRSDAAFGERRIPRARRGLILVPHEDVGRLPWWLLGICGRIAKTGPATWLATGHAGTSRSS
jgi:hypothetical protein